MIVNWADLALYSYEEVILFIVRKWNIVEAENSPFWFLNLSTY